MEWVRKVASLIGYGRDASARPPYRLLSLGNGVHEVADEARRFLSLRGQHSAKLHRPQSIRVRLF